MMETTDLSLFLEDCSELSLLEKEMGRIAAKEAFQSEDSTKVGAVIFKDGVLISAGHNHLVGDINKVPVEVNEINKSKFTIHGEMRAILTINKQYNSLEGATMIVVGKCPCTDCAKAIIMSGITEVICPIPDLNSRWIEENDLALKILEASNVKVKLIRELAGDDIGLTCRSKYIV